MIRVKVRTNPIGHTFSVDGMPYNTQQQFNWIAGSSHTIAATSPQSGGSGAQYIWKKWSDNGPSSHVVAPTTNKTYTAQFQTQYFLTMSAETGAQYNQAVAGLTPERVCSLKRTQIRASPLAAGWVAVPVLTPDRTTQVRSSWVGLLPRQVISVLDVTDKNWIRSRPGLEHLQMRARAETPARRIYCALAAKPAKDKIHDHLSRSIILSWRRIRFGLPA